MQRSGTESADSVGNQEASSRGQESASFRAGGPAVLRPTAAKPTAEQPKDSDPNAGGRNAPRLSPWRSNPGQPGTQANTSQPRVSDPGAGERTAGRTSPWRSNPAQSPVRPPEHGQPKPEPAKVDGSGRTGQSGTEAGREPDVAGLNAGPKSPWGLGAGIRTGLRDDEAYWPGPYRKARSSAFGLWSTAIAIVAIAIALASFYRTSMVEDDLSRNRASILNLEQQNRQLAADLQVTATDARAASEALTERRGSTPSQPAQAAAEAPSHSASPDGTFAQQSAPPGPAAAATQQRMAPGAPAPAYANPVPAGVNSPQQPLSTPNSRPETPAARVAPVNRAPIPAPAAPAPAPSAAKSSNTLPPAVAAEVPATVSPLAQNIERVEALQRHTNVRLREFHVAEGSVTRPFPDVGIEVKKLDQKHGSFRLVVLGSESRSEQRGSLDQPMPIVDGSTGKHYRLVITDIQSHEIYGYLSEAR